MSLPPNIIQHILNNIMVSETAANTPYSPYRGHVPEHIARQFSPENQYERQAGQLAARAGEMNPAFTAISRELERGAEGFPRHAQAYMNPYQQQVLDRIAQQGNRNLTENILPELEARFVRLGQHGGSRHADLSRRAARDIQSEISGRQAEAAHQGYGQAMQGFDWDQARRIKASTQQAQMAQMMNAQRLADVESLQRHGAYGREVHERPFRAAGVEHHMMQMDPRERRNFMTGVLHGVPFRNMQTDVPRSMHSHDWQNLAGGIGMNAAAGAARAAAPAFMRGVGDLFRARPMGSGNLAAQGLFGSHVRNFMP